MTLLGEVQRIQFGEEYGIQIHRQQVVEILAVFAGEGVGGPVTGGEGVHKSIEGATDHHEKRITHRVFFAATECGVLQNVGDSGGIRGYGAQGHHKDVLIVIRSDMVVHCAGGFVAVFGYHYVQGFDGFAAQPLEAAVALLLS